MRTAKEKFKVICSQCERVWFEEKQVESLTLPCPFCDRRKLQDRVDELESRLDDVETKIDDHKIWDHQ